MNPFTAKTQRESPAISWPLAIRWAKWMLVFGLFALVCSIFYPAIKKNRHYEERKARLSSMIDSERQTYQEALKEKELLLHNPHYLERTARDVLGVRKANEIVFQWDNAHNSVMIGATWIVRKRDSYEFILPDGSRKQIDCTADSFAYLCANSPPDFQWVKGRPQGKDLIPLHEIIERKMTAPSWVTLPDGRMGGRASMEAQAHPHLIAQNNGSASTHTGMM